MGIRPPRKVERPEEPKINVTLHSLGSTSVVGNVGACLTNVFQVIAIGDNLNPVPGVTIRYEIITGPLQFRCKRIEIKTLEVTTNRNGIAAVDAMFTSIGSAIVATEIKADPVQAVFFSARTQGVTHQLFIYSDPCFPVDPGTVTTRIVAVDHLERPVTGANLIFQATLGKDNAIEGSVTELGNGEYEGRFQTHIAGEWTLLVQDINTRVSTRDCVHLVPGESESLRLIGEIDPRVSRPFSEVLLRVVLEDRFGNALDPHRINATRNGEHIQSQVILGEEARFPINFIGFGDVKVQLFDIESSLSRRLTIDFAAAWLENPEPVFIGDIFRTVLYGIPRPDSPVRLARINVLFNTNLMTFIGLIKSSEGPNIATSIIQRNGSLTITAAAGEEISAAEFPEGIPIGTLLWRCIGEGVSCFSVTAEAVPEPVPTGPSIPPIEPI